MKVVAVSYLLTDTPSSGTVVAERLTFSGFNVTRLNGRTRFPGYPFTTSRISSITGILSSLVAKKISTLDKKQPPFSSIKNV